MNGEVTAWAALVVYLVGLILVFGFRTWWHWRRTGSTGFRGVSGPVGSLSWWGSALFVGALVSGGAAPVLALAGALPLPAALLHPITVVVGLVAAVAGLGVTLAAQGSMGASWRIGVDASEPTELVTSGLFRWVRNPIFIGMGMVIVGAALLVPTFPAALAVLCYIAAVQIQVRVTEEPYLARQHGATYQSYRARTGRFVPRLPL